MSRGTVLLAVGAVMLAAGLIGAAYGIGLAIGQSSALADDAVARGVVGGPDRAFESPQEKLTVYLDFHGLRNEETYRDDTAGDTDCLVTAKGFEDSFSGSRQGVSATLGDYVTVGSFTLPATAGRIRCTGSDVPFLVTPHGGGEVFGSVGIILGAVVLAGLGGWAAIVGWLRRRDARRLEGLGIPQ